ncbi:PepSY-associated TM helix domain-containing protein [Cylindrospermum sp. FACHB-282]|uniref:PepSY-associated TM helix domain-containing protein n=1 Tax=Cylindrospermum sp. FACHB-282 TaxID=2692794 RepID=UPI001685978E|nr:PepSY-associated TM helix domain-containing protein [Cylindrospermum sp. FACHB-282]MBD2385746.1 PepSY domain-containing protein [Cylindrospermum sp. FACHB-282]
MKPMKIRNIAFILHRYIGLAVGLLLIFVGLTGSLLVFEDEIDELIIAHQFEKVIPQGERISVESALNLVTAAYANRPDLQPTSIITLPKKSTYVVRMSPKEGENREVFVNPYTGAILGDRGQETSLRFKMIDLHYSLLAGKTGAIIVGIGGFLLFVLAISGLVLWPGWRRLISGFKIKLNAHPKRALFDIHKVAGIVSAVFLTLIAFTGFCWNFEDFTKPAIYAVTFTSKLSKPVSQLVPGKSPLGIDEILQKVDSALTDAVTSFILLPKKPEDVFSIYQKLPQEINSYGNSAIYLDQYSGEILRIDNALKAPLGDRILNSFYPLHYGTFGGLPTRILYVFVGLSPLILFITGLGMYRYKYPGKNGKQQAMKIFEPSDR